MFAASAAAAVPTRYWLWAAGLAIQVLGFVVGFRRWTPPASQEGDAVIAATPSLIERFDLFAIIVLGEVIVGAIDVMSEVAPVGPDEIVIGLLGILVAIGLWWVYFDLVSHQAPISNRTQLWLYLHLPLVIAIAAGGAGVLNTVEHANDGVPDAVRWLLVASLAVAMVSVAAIAQTLEIQRRLPDVYRSAEVALVISGLVCVGVGLTPWGAKAILTAMVLLLAGPVATGLVVWLKHTDADTAVLD